MASLLRVYCCNLLLLLLVCYGESMGNGTAEEPNFTTEPLVVTTPIVTTEPTPTTELIVTTPTVTTAQLTVQPFLNLSLVAIAPSCLRLAWSLVAAVADENSNPVDSDDANALRDSIQTFELLLEVTSRDRTREYPMEMTVPGDLSSFIVGPLPSGGIVSATVGVRRFFSGTATLFGIESSAVEIISLPNNDTAGMYCNRETVCSACVCSSPIVSGTNCDVFQFQPSNVSAIATSPSSLLLSWTFNENKYTRLLAREGITLSGFQITVSSSTGEVASEATLQITARRHQAEGLQSGEVYGVTVSTLAIDSSEAQLVAAAPTLLTAIQGAVSCPTPPPVASAGALSSAEVGGLVVGCMLAVAAAGGGLLCCLVAVCQGRRRRRRGKERGGREIDVLNPAATRARSGTDLDTNPAYGVSCSGAHNSAGTPTHTVEWNGTRTAEREEWIGTRTSETSEWNEDAYYSQVPTDTTTSSVTYDYIPAGL